MFVCLFDLALEDRPIYDRIVGTGQATPIYAYMVYIVYSISDGLSVQSYIVNIYNKNNTTIRFILLLSNHSNILLSITSAFNPPPLLLLR